MLEMVNTTQTPLTVSENIPFSSVTFNTNGNTSGNPQTGVASISEPGIYTVTGVFVIEATAEGNVTINLIGDGNTIPGATAEFSAAAANTIETVSIVKEIQVDPAASGNVAQVSFQPLAGSAASTLINAVMSVKKVG